MKRNIFVPLLLAVLFSCNQSSDKKRLESVKDFKLSEFQNVCDYFYAQQLCDVALLDFQKLLRSKKLSSYTDLPPEDYKNLLEIEDKRAKITDAMEEKYTEAEIAECDLFKKLEAIGNQFKSQRSELQKNYTGTAEARGEEEQKLFDRKEQLQVDIIKNFK